MTDRFKLSCAVHLFVVDEGHVLLLRRRNTGYGDGKLSVVAGHLNGGEDIKAAAIREAREEAGVEAVPEALRVVGVIHGRSDDERIDFFLVAESWAGQIVNAELRKRSELAWFDLAALPEDVIRCVRAALDNYKRGRWFDSFGWSCGSPPASTPA